MTEPSKEPAEPQPADHGTRFEATVHPGEKDVSLARVADLGLDRVPDPDGGVRLLLTAQECAQLLERGYEVHLLRAVPVQPLSRELVEDDDGATRWLEGRVQGIERQEGS